MQSYKLTISCVIFVAHCNRLSKAPPAPPVSKQQPKQQHNTNNNSNNNHHHHQEQQHNNHHHHHNGGEPELPNAGRREKEPANDETQVQ